jgi:hypothetical protein
MPEYRIYPISQDNHIVGAVMRVTCETDDEAVAKARQLTDGRDAELWDGIRRVGRVKSQGAA